MKLGLEPLFRATGKMLALEMLALAFCCAATAPAQAASEPCGGVSAPCELETGIYHMASPETASGAPIVVYLHGYRGSGAGVIKNRSMVAAAVNRGAVFVAPSAMPRPGSRNAAWAIQNGLEPHRDEVAFLRSVIGDVVARTGADRGQVLLTGFSLGGSMVWDAACHAPDLAAAYAPASGAFWTPLPAACRTPVRLYHTHGMGDRTVPMEGRAVMNGRIRQGDLFEGLEVLRHANGCPASAPEAVSISSARRMWEWRGCSDGALRLALHTGGHGLPKGWLTKTLDWFETLGG